jgi:hypothetical protein
MNSPQLEILGEHTWLKSDMPAIAFAGWVSAPIVTAFAGADGKLC